VRKVHARVYRESLFSARAGIEVIQISDIAHSALALAVFNRRHGSLGATRDRPRKRETGLVDGVTRSNRAKG